MYILQSTCMTHDVFKKNPDTYSIAYRTILCFNFFVISLSILLVLKYIFENSLNQCYGTVELYLKSFFINIYKSDGVTLVLFSIN